MLYAQVIWKLLRKEDYNRFAKYITKSFFGDAKSVWYEIFLRIQQFHVEHDSDLSFETLRQAHLSDLAGSPTSKQDAVKAAYLMMEGTTVHDEADYLLTKIRRRGILSDVAEEVVKELTENKEAELVSITDKLQNLAAEEFEDEEITYTIDLLESEADYQASRQWKWAIPELDEAVQGAGPERTCLIVALTNVGKTSFVCYNNVSFMRQGAKVLHFAIAEDSKVSLQRRYYQAAYGINDYQLDSEKRRYRDQFMSEFDGKLILAPVDSLTIAQAEQIIKQHKPDIVVFDDFKDLELDKKSRDSREHKQYGQIAVRIKSLSIKYGFFGLCCAQAADSATGKRYLDRQDIADSKVDIPAKFQYVLGLSRGESNSKDLRYISTIKNKLGPEDFKYSALVKEDCCKWS